MPIQAGASFSYSVFFSTLLKKLNVVVTVEMLNKIVSIRAVHMLKGKFGVESH